MFHLVVPRQKDVSSSSYDYVQSALPAIVQKVSVMDSVGDVAFVTHFYITA